MYKQCKLYDYDTDIYFGGIYNEETGDVICAHCGKILPADDITTDTKDKSRTTLLIKIYETWEDFSETIID